MIQPKTKFSFFLTFTLLIKFLSNISTSYALPPLELYPSFQDVISKTFELKASNADVYAKEADMWQAGAYPNPALAVNINSIGRKQNDEENELFVGVSQLVELGGKRAARLRVADANQCAAQWNYLILKNELFSKLLHAFIEMAAAQERLALAQGQQLLAQQTLEAISTKSTSGKTSGIDEKKAQVAFRSTKLIYLKQQANLRKTKKQLLSIWDSCPPQFDEVNFPLFNLLPPPPLETLNAALKCNPELIKAEAESALASELVALEKSRKIPDIAFQVGVTAENFIHQPALSIGFAMPLPIFDQNQGNISRAGFEQIQSIYNQMDLSNQLHSTLEIIYHDWMSAYEEANILRESILPAAEEAFQLAQVSYHEGKFDYLNFLDARSALFDVQQQYLDSVEEYHHKRAEILKLTATYPRNEF